MPLAPIVINDGQNLYGCPTITFGGQVFQIIDIDFTTETARYVRKNSLGIPDGKVVITGESMGSMTINYPTSATASPPVGTAGTVQMEPGGPTFSIHTETPAVKRTQNGLATATIKYSVDLTTNITVATS